MWMGIDFGLIAIIMLLYALVIVSVGFGYWMGRKTRTIEPMVDFRRPEWTVKKESIDAIEDPYFEALNGKPGRIPTVDE